jgi:TonB family protein
MIADIMAHILLVSGILTLAGIVMEFVMKGRGYPRRWSWMGVIALSALTAVGLLLAPPARPADPVREGEYSALFGSVTVWENADAELSGWHPAKLALDLVFLPIKAWDRGLDGLATLTGGLAWVLEQNPIGETGLAILWGVLSILAAVILALSARRLRRTTGVLPVERVDGRDFTVAETLGPAVVGFLRPKIVLPSWLLGTPADTLSLVITHEEEHLRARDTLLLASGLGAIVLAPWNLFAWIQLRRLRLAIEMDCDARVIRRGVPPTQYASVLVEVGGRILLHVFVDATGAVANCRVSQSSGYPELDNAALRVCPVYSFVPAQNAGQPAVVWVQIPVEFSAR